jgi:hypothetical protein
MYFTQRVEKLLALHSAWRVCCGDSGNVYSDALWNLPVNVLLERVESNSMSTRETVVFFNMHRLSANSMGFAKGTQMSPTFAAYDLDWNSNSISHSTALRPFS